MSTAELTVIVPPDLADGYRLGGVHTESADTAAAAAGVLNQLISAVGPPGVVAVHAPYLRELDARWQHRLSRADRLLVVALPEGSRGHDQVQAGENLRDLLARAVGYELTFDPTGSTS
jgi:vacuolar-type H+-ATPase subunit F/Vma7